MSGLSRTPGKRVGVYSPPRVRIPLPPPGAHPAFPRVPSGVADARVDGLPVHPPFWHKNEWVRRGLPRAGVRTPPLWSPVDAALMWQAERAAR